MAEPRPRAYLGPIDVALKQGSQALAEELHALLESLDFDALMPEVVHQQVESVRRRLKSLHRRASNDADITQLLEDLKELLAEYKPDATTWDALRSDLTEAYETLTSILTADDPDKPARPVNYTRSIFHMGSAVFCLTLVIAVLSPTGVIWVAGGFAAAAWTAEITRRISPRANVLLMRFFGPVAHPSEHRRVNSATWYVTALIGLALTGSPTLQVVSVAVLGFGDPIAGLIGRRFGRTRLVNGRSLEGTAAFVVAATLAATAALALVRPELGWGLTVLIAFAGGLSGALAELFSRSVDDNLSIPVASFAGTLAIVSLLGLSF